LNDEQGWVAERLKLALLTPTSPAALHEKMAALKQLLGDDELLFKELTAGIRTKDARPLDIFDSVSGWLVAGGDPRCL